MQLRVRQSRTSAYAFTDYRSQGQTIPYEVVNTAKPPSGAAKSVQFQSYVALSRSPGSADHYH
ncbi:hypothetical protein EDC04DRAFT_3125766 [Pisolithus marmoratus]|nr:hypothetical protein EDC04DRAFT_3125766 [Pisolithus marmoratus]